MAKADPFAAVREKSRLDTKFAKEQQARDLEILKQQAAAARELEMERGISSRGIQREALSEKAKLDLQGLRLEQKVKSRQVRLQERTFAFSIWDKYKSLIIGLVIFIFLLGPSVSIIADSIGQLSPLVWGIILIVAIIVWRRR